MPRHWLAVNNYRGVQAIETILQEFCAEVGEDILIVRSIIKTSVEAESGSGFKSRATQCMSRWLSDS